MLMALSRGIATSLRDPQGWKKLGLPALLAMVALGVPVIGASVIGSGGGVDGVNGFVESLSGNSSTWLGGVGLGVLAPLGFAFAAGMASAVNPCGFAMLPAYLGMYLGSGQQAGEAAGPARNLGKAMLVGSTVTGGFVVLFGAAGAVMGLGARSFVVGVMPWLGLAVGVALALAGSWMVGGGKLYTGLAAQAAARMGDPSKTNIKGYFVFGLSYGTASLSCTLPIFLAVVGTSLAVSNLFAAMGQFVLYALGMGLVILALTLGIAFFKEAMVGALRKAMPYVQPVGSWLMVVAGAYIVFYWLTIGGLF